MSANLKARIAKRLNNKAWKYGVLQIVMVVLFALVTIIFIIPGSGGETHGFAIGIILLLALGFLYRIAAKQLKPKGNIKTDQSNPYHGFFFKGTAILTAALVLLGIFGAFFVYVEHDNLFQAVGLVTAIIWIGAFLMYFMWAVYHYNINYGITDQDWEKIFEAEERHKKGFPVKPTELEAPKNNPYRSQTFGLPPGTVRGMIAFTLLIGGMSLLIVSFGTEYTGAELALVRQQFEFFETAFLMMIAFYFGDKSLRYLQKRWKDPNSRTGDVEKSTSPAPTKTADHGGEPKDPVYDDDLEYLEDEKDYRVERDLPAPEKKSSIARPLLGSQEQEIEYVQVMDNLHQKVLSDQAIRDTLEELKRAENIELSLPVVKAIVAVESSGRGHLPDGRAKILFEGHKFWHWLDKFGKDPESLQAGHSNILYKQWTRRNYLGGAEEYKRLEAAKKIDQKAAIYATSWGLFQILGENLESFIKSRKYRDHLEFEEKQHESEHIHFLDFLAFIKTKKVRGKPLIHYVSEERQGNYDWAAFAYGYNGNGYKLNRYDVKLQEAYHRFKEADPAKKAGWIPIIDAGHGGLVNGRYLTPGKRYTFDDGTEIFEGVINRSIGNRLARRLKEAGIPYFQTTLETEADMDLEERTAIANRLFESNPNCYFLSIHSNSSSDSLSGKGNNASGFEIYTSIGKTKSDDMASIAARWYKRLFPDFPFRENKTEGGEYQNKEAGFIVLKNTRCPAFLVENLFFDNRKEADFLLSEGGQQRIADCLFKIVEEIYNSVEV